MKIKIEHTEVTVRVEIQEDDATIDAVMAAINGCLIALTYPQSAIDRYILEEAERIKSEKTR